MNFQTIILQLGQGMLVTVEIFFLTLLFSLPLGLLVAFGRMSKNVLLKGISNIYFYYERYAVDAAADRGILRTVLFIWN